MVEFQSIYLIEFRYVVNVLNIFVVKWANYNLFKYNDQNF